MGEKHSHLAQGLCEEGLQPQFVLLQMMFVLNVSHQINVQDGIKGICVSLRNLWVQRWAALRFLSAVTAPSWVLLD